MRNCLNWYVQPYQTICIIVVYKKNERSFTELDIIFLRNRKRKR